MASSGSVGFLGSGAGSASPLTGMAPIGKISIRPSTARRIARRSIRQLKCRSPRGQWHERLIGGSENAASGSAGCAGRTDANDGSRLLIFVLHARVDRSPVAEQPERLDHPCRSTCVGIVESSAVCFGAWFDVAPDLNKEPGQGLYARDDRSRSDQTVVSRSSDSEHRFGNACELSCS
jgi:hypothetical protein